MAVFYPHFTTGFCETASEAYAVFDCFTTPSVATGLTSHFKKMWVRIRAEARGMNGPTFEGGLDGVAPLPLNNCSNVCDNASMRKMFQYRIYPNKKQVKALEATLEACRWLYNHLLEKRRDAWEQEGISLSLYQQQEAFSILKQERPSLKGVHSQVLQNVAVRIDLAFKAFFRRCKAGESPGYPRFRG
jgi:hypothetical protein